MTFHAIAISNNGTGNQWTPPSGMTERADVATNTNSAASNIGLEANELLETASGATGTFTAQMSLVALGVTETIALKPIASPSCTVTVQVSKQPGSTLGSVTTVLGRVATPTLRSVSIATSAATFATGDRLQLDVVVPNDSVNCSVRLSHDDPAAPSKLTVATIVPEGVLGLLLLAPALPFAARWWKRRRP